MNRQCDAWLTPQMERIFSDGAEGNVHSVFSAAANISLGFQGARRMFTLTCGTTLRLPDSAHAPDSVIRGLEPGMPVKAGRTLSGFALEMQSDTLMLRIQTNWNGRLPKQEERLPSPRHDRLREAARALASVSTGFDLMPQAVRTRAKQALLTNDAPAFLGLGAGLTPSFDDACIGVMACCAAFSYPVPFDLTELGATTEISARYLNLAREGYFGEPICLVMEALGGKGGMQTALSVLLGVGATSGADMLQGAVSMASSKIA